MSYKKRKNLKQLFGNSSAIRNLVYLSLHDLHQNTIESLRDLVIISKSC